MEPVTHALVGLGVASFSGEPLSLATPVYLASLLGSLAPDLDIVLQLKGDLVYLRHHRGFSHSLPGITLVSAIIAGALSLIWPAGSLAEVFFWAFAGALSHSILDIFNSYGVQLFWPLSPKKLTINLLHIFDPVFFSMISLMILLETKYPMIITWGAKVLILYLILRYWVARRVRRFLAQKYAVKAQRIMVMPALKGIWNWDVLVETGHSFIVGRIHSFSLIFELRKKLLKQQNRFIRAALESKLGMLFKEFTPVYYVEHRHLPEGHRVEFFDLRYYLKQQFLHTGTAVFDEENKLVEEVFSPYLGRRNVKIAG